MPWGWILAALLVPAGLVLLALALFHVRFRASWRGEWNGFASVSEGAFFVEYGFPGFMRRWTGRDDGRKDASDERFEAEAAKREPGGRSASSSVPNDEGDKTAREHRENPSVTAEARPERPAAASSAPPFRPPAPDSRPPSPDSRRPPSGPRRDRNRWRRALFRLATDAPAWKLLARHGFRSLRAMLRLLHVRASLSVGHPDPVLLGRFAGAWHAAAPVLPGSVALDLRFQDRRPTLALSAEGGFSLLSLLCRGLFLVGSFPWIGLARRARVAWKEHELAGWRRWAYRKIQGMRN